MPDCTLDEAVVTAIITDATNYINNMLVDCDNLTVAEIDSITKWFAAHMIASGPDRQARREKLGDAEVSYDGNTSTDIGSTTYGRMALTLDRCGQLKKAGKRAVVIKAVTSFE